MNVWLRLPVLVGASLLASMLGCSDSPLPAPSGSDAEAASGLAGDVFGVEDLAFCQEGPRYAYSPDLGLEPVALPDDYFSVDDPAAPSGRRLVIDAQSLPWLAGIDPAEAAVYEALTGLDGWGVSAPLFMRFEGPIGPPPSGAEASLLAPELRLLALGEGMAERVPYEAELLDEGRMLLVWPMRPLASGTRHALVMTREYPSADGACVVPSETLKALLQGEADTSGQQAVREGFEALFGSTSLAPGEISAATVFRTQTTTERSRTVAAEIQAATLTWAGPARCEAWEYGRTCERRLRTRDFREEAGENDTWELPVSMWFPDSVTGPDSSAYPTLIVGHGMNGNRTLGATVAAMVADLGIAVLASDAMAHGQHPSAEGLEGLFVALTFLGVVIDETRVDGRVMRDNFQQSNWDRLQLIKALRQSADLDDDGVLDIDVDRLGYLGVSLGGIMGSELLAVSDALSVGVLLVPGARVTSMFSHAPPLAVMMNIVSQITGSEAGAWRLLAVLQAAVDGGDPASYAGHVLTRRFDDKAPPDLLVAMALDDDTVPNVTTAHLARALGLPLMAPVTVPIDGLSVVSEPELRANMPGGSTAALFQYDRVTETETETTVPATHDNVPFSPEAKAQIRHFLGGWVAGDVPVIIDPYTVMGTLPL